MKKCCYCNSYIVYQGYYEDWTGNCICESHGPGTRCASCQRIIGPNVDTKEVELGRYICNLCIENRVTYKDLDWVLKQVLAILHRNGFQDIQCDWVTFKIISKREMDSIFRDAAGVHSASIIYDQIIYVLDYTTKIEFASTLAHELIHAWQMENNIEAYNNYCWGNEVSKKIIEGFAQMGSFLVLNTIKHPFAKSRLNDMFRSDDEVYGIPFQKIHKHFMELGGDLNAWFGIIREARLGLLKV